MSDYKNPDAQKVQTVSERLRHAFESAKEAKDLLIQIANDKRLNSAELSDLKEKILAIQNSVDVVMSNS